MTKLNIQATTEQLIAMTNRIQMLGTIKNIYSIDSFRYMINELDNEVIEVKWFNGVIQSFENITRKERFYTSEVI